MKLFKKPQYGKNLHAFTFLFTIHLQCVATQLRTFAVPNKTLAVLYYDTRQYVRAGIGEVKTILIMKLYQNKHIRL